MGTYQGTYIGVYMEVPYGTEKETESFYVHPTTGVKMDTQYCPDTGVEGVLKTKTNTVDKYPHPYTDDVEGLDEDMFFSPEYDGAGKKLKTFVLNSTKTRYAPINIGENEAFNLDGKIFANADKLIKEFREEYEDYINYFEKEYGLITIHFGVVNYYH